MTNQWLKCPGCAEADEVHHSHLRFRDLPILVVGMRPYRCLQCYRRFYAWKRPRARVHAGKAAQNRSA